MKASTGADSPGFRTSTGRAAVLIIPDRLYHLRATHASKCDFITTSP